MNADIVGAAITFACEKHAGQKDDSGEDYFTAHCLNSFMLIQKVTNDDSVMAAALLHDVLEDTVATLGEVEERFGSRVARLVLMVTHAGSKSKGHYFPNLKAGVLTNGWIASREDYRDAVLVKFADRLSNLSRMDCWDGERVDAYLRKSKFWSTEKRMEVE